MSINFLLIFKISLFLCIFAKTHFCALLKKQLFGIVEIYQIFTVFLF